MFGSVSLLLKKIQHGYIKIFLTLILRNVSWASNQY